MSNTLQISFRLSGKTTWIAALAIVYLITFILGLSDYVDISSMHFVLGLLAIAFVTSPSKQSPSSVKFAFIALLFSGICQFIPGRTSLYFAETAAILFLIESFFGRLTFLPFVAIILASPIFNYLSDVFSFPIRLEITEWSAHLLSLSGQHAEAIGNVIHYRGTEMSVDPECMGLNMMVSSCLAAIMFISVFGKKYNVKVSAWIVFLSLVAILLLNVVSNLLRIITLVHLSVLPGSIGHEIVGILSFLLYVILPGMFLVDLVTRKFGNTICTSNEWHEIKSPSPTSILLNSLLAVLVIAAVCRLKNQEEPSIAGRHVPSLENYSSSRITNDIIKLESPSSLVYLKYIPGFYNADHNPMICWRGSGYVFTHVREEKINGTNVYTGQLQKPGENLFTAWWYENGYKRTDGQWQWRKDVLMGGQNYYLINVTCQNAEGLIEEVTRIQSNQQLKSFLSQTK